MIAVKAIEICASRVWEKRKVVISGAAISGVPRVLIALSAVANYEVVPDTDARIASSIERV